VSVEYRIGDVRALLAEMPAGSVDLILSSPPYLSLRSYLAADDPMKALEIGSERTPAEYISTLLGLTAEFRRVLAPHGSIAIELGDTFSGSGGAGGDYNANGLREGQPRFRQGYDRRDGRKTMQQGNYEAALPGNGPHGGEGWPLERSLAMIPELYRVALAYGIHPLTGETSPAGRWRVRNVVVHGRPNPPVGALGDKFRPACSYWAVVCINRRWFDLDAVRTEPVDTRIRFSNGPKYVDVADQIPGRRDRLKGYPTRYSNSSGAPPLDWFEDESDQFERDLWTIPTFGYKGAHYATFAPELVRRFIVSMCPARVCRECGKPSTRITDTKRIAPKDDRQRKTKAADYRLNGHDHPPEIGWEMDRRALGWTDCGHNAWRAGSVLDPFGGSGTTGMVAAGNGRDAILFDLDERNLTLARERIARAAAIWANPPEVPEKPMQGAWEL
jgi:site-specific DNA-methyltransferase (adenine-specific)